MKNNFETFLTCAIYVTAAMFFIFPIGVVTYKVRSHRNYLEHMNEVPPCDIRNILKERPELFNPRKEEK